jgi:uncharacterized oxidoreductase
VSEAIFNVTAHLAFLKGCTMTTTPKKFLITGGAGGIGLALARALIAEGNAVIACGRDQGRLDAARTLVPELLTRQCDVSDRQDRTALVNWIAQEHPDLSALINNAAVQTKTDFSRPLDEAQVTAEMQINFLAPLMLSLELLPILKSQDAAMIINLSSGLAFCPVASLPVYSASKAALHSVTLSLRHQLASQAVRVIEIIAPPVDTSLGGHAALDAIAAGLPVLKPEEFAAEVVGALGKDQDEIAIGIAQASRQQGEALFALMNQA